MKILWLFDIDGTLVDINHLHLSAHKHSFKKVMNLSPSTDLLKRNFGLPGNRYRETVLKELNVNNFSKLALLEENFNQHLITEINKSHVEPLPGAVKFLKHLSKDKNNTIGIITGNREDGGKAILKKVNLLHFFSTFGFDKGKSREEMLEELIKKNNHSKTIVIGDTDKDINAGKCNHCITIAVATGSLTYEQLKKENPDILLKTFEEYQKIMLNPKLNKT